MHAKARRRYPRWLTTLMVSLMVLLFILSLPLTLPVTLVLNFLDKHRMRKAAKTFACEKCDQLLGIEALAAADQAWAEHVSKLSRNNPGKRYRLARRVHAICPHCKTKYTFLSKKRTFIVYEKLLGSSKPKP